jgi:hypothetical protein
MQMSDIQQEIVENARLRWGLWTIVSIVLLYLCLVLSDMRAVLVNDYAATSNRLWDVNNVARQSEWIKRDELAAALRTEFSGRLWKSRSEGLAQATFQTWLDQQLLAFRLDGLRIQMLPVEPGGQKLALWKVAARIQGDVDLSAFQRLLYRLESHAQLTQVDSLVVRNNRRKTIDMTVVAWFKPEDG